MLNDLQKLKGGDDFEVVTISTDRRAEEPAQWFKAKNIDALTPWHDKSFSFPARLQARGVPFTILYDRYGQERARIFGEVDWTAPEAVALIDYLVSE